MKYIEVEKIKIPYWEIISKKEGPSILICAEQHGNEVNGSEVIRRFYEIIKDRIVKGKVYLIPFMNLPALYNRRPHIDSKVGQPYKEGENMNLKWPGKEDGSLIEKIVYKINKEIVEKCDYCIDLHSWTHFWASTSLPVKNQKESLKLAEISKIKFIKPRDAEKKYQNILSAIVFFNRKTSLTIEFSGQYQINEKEVKIGVRALKNICKYLGIMKGEIEGKDEKIVWLDRCKDYEIKSETTGLFIKNEKIKLGDYIKKGSVLGWIFNEKTLETIDIYSPVDGFLYYFGAHRLNCDVDLASCHPFVMEGEIIGKIIESKND